MRTIFTLLAIVMAETRLALSLKSVMLMFLAAAEVIGLVILFPFLALLTDSKYAENNEYIYYFQQQFSMDHQSLVIFTGLLVIIYLITVNCFKSWIYFKINFITNIA